MEQSYGAALSDKKYAFLSPKRGDVLQRTQIIS